MSSKAAPFDSQALVERLFSYPRATRYLVGFSGGADSTALLEALHSQEDSIPAGIEAVHFNHALQPESDRWQAHCESFCAARNIPLISHQLQIEEKLGSLEERAREARYRYVERHIDSHTIYLTAHNADDRAETFLLNAVRGSGLDGLASIPEIRSLGTGYVARPLLEFPRLALTQYLERKGTRWIEDPSNRDIGIDRNFIRLEVMPLLQSRWPAARDTLARAARHLRTASSTLQELLVRHAELDRFGALELPLAALDSLGSAARGLILRAWLRARGAPPLPEVRLEEFLRQLETSAPGSKCEASWEGWALRQYRDRMYLLPPGELPTCPERAWNAVPRLQLGPGLGAVQLSGDGRGLPDHWTVAPRRPGGKIQLQPGGPRKMLKNVFQEMAIPPWQRRSVPVLYWGEDAVAIGDWSLAPRFEAWLAQHRLRYRWEPDDPELRRFRANFHETAPSGSPLDRQPALG